MCQRLSGVTHSGVGTLRGFTHHLHDEVPLRLKHTQQQRLEASRGRHTTVRIDGRCLVPSLTSLSKLALVNSSEFSRALVAASLTLLLGSSFLMPWMMAVRIWLAFSCSCSGSWRRSHGRVTS